MGASIRTSARVNHSSLFTDHFKGIGVGGVTHQNGGGRHELAIEVNPQPPGSLRSYHNFTRFLGKAA
jgi:hypothetical protein